MGFDACEPADMYKIIDINTNIVAVDTSSPELPKETRSAPNKMDTKEESNAALNFKRKGGVATESSNLEAKKMKLEGKKQGKFVHL